MNPDTLILRLPVLMMPFSTSLFPELTEHQKGLFKGILRRRRGCCHYCGRTLTKKNASLDHIVPRCNGGLDTPDNLLICCGACNGHKDNYSLDAWLQRLETMVERLREVRPMLTSG